MARRRRGAGTARRRAQRDAGRGPRRSHVRESYRRRIKALGKPLADLHPILEGNVPGPSRAAHATEKADVQVIV